MASSLVKNKGLTLVELLVASAVGLTGLAIVSSLFTVGIKTTSRLTTELSFVQELNDTARFIKDDARRAGYALDESVTGITTWAGTTDIMYISPTTDCIAYAYQYIDGTTSKVRYTSIYHKNSGTPQRGTVVLYSRNQDITDVPLNISSACTGGEAITDSKVVDVNNLSFNKNAVNYQVDFELAGRYLDDSTITETMQSVIKIRNWGG